MTRKGGGCSAGDVARIPPGAAHWPGAHPDEPQALTHLAITCGTASWLEPMSEEEYRGCAPPGPRLLPNPESATIGAVASERARSMLV